MRMVANPIRKIYIHVKFLFLLKVFHLQDYSRNHYL